MKENLLLLLFEVTLLLLSQCDDSIASSDSGVIEVVAPELRVSPAQAEDLELCYSLKVPEGIFFQNLPNLIQVLLTI